MKPVTLILIFALAPLSGAAVASSGKATTRPYRWLPKEWKPLPYLMSASLDKFIRGEKPVVPISVSFGEVAKSQELFPAKGEIVGRGFQRLGPARVEGTWTQTIFHPDGHVLYAAGSVYDELPSAAMRARLKIMENRRKSLVAHAERQVEGLRHAAKTFEPELMVRKLEGDEYWAYWRLEYLPPAQDRLLYVLAGEDGRIETGQVSLPSAEGRALVYPAGPGKSEVTEMPIYNLLGDGTLTGRRLKVQSALNLNVWAPDLRFFYAENDRRFDLAQVYFTIDEAFRWLSERLKVELGRPLEVRLHIGDNGVSNAAFYHQNTVYLGTGDGVAYRDLTKDPSVLIHEAMHAVIDAYVGLPSEGQGGALNEGFADLFAALILDNPRLGEVSYLKGPYRRTLEHGWKAYRDFTGGVYRDGSIVAATFWDMRPILGNDKLAQLAFRTLTRLGKGAELSDFVPALLAAASGLLTSEEQIAVLEKASSRGWVVIP